MTSGIAAYLRAEIQRRIWTYEQAAAAAGLRKSTLAYIVNTPGTRPDLETLDRIATGWGLELADLIRACGYAIRDGGNAQTQEQRLARLLEQVPELRGLVEYLIQFRPRDLEVIQAYVEGYLEDLKRPREGPGPRR